MAKRSKDLFDDSVMTFGEHLEALRSHLLKALAGLVLGLLVCLYWGDRIFAVVRWPLDRALANYGTTAQVEDDLDEVASWRDRIWRDFGLDMLWGEGGDGSDSAEPATGDAPTVVDPSALRVEVDARELASALHALQPEVHPAPADDLAGTRLPVTIYSPAFAELQGVVQMSRQPVTLNVQEAFMTYLKVTMVAGLVLSSPWIFLQLWLFVAAGLYPHERKYVYWFGGVSLVLFVVGVVFCFIVVFPFVLRFLFEFNTWMKTTLQPRLSEWISFAIILPLMFGVSFQLPLVMVFLDRLQIMGVAGFREHRRMAILIISIISMVLTPADPVSMLLMMFPLMLLYELGIWMCRFQMQPALAGAGVPKVIESSPPAARN